MTARPVRNRLQEFEGDFVLLQLLDDQRSPWALGRPNSGNGLVGPARLLLQGHNTVQKNHRGCTQVDLTVDQHPLSAQALKRLGYGDDMLFRRRVERDRDLNELDALLLK